MRTYAPKAHEIQRAWHVIDADGLVLGRLSTEVARLLRGKHRPYFAPNLDTGDHVVIINASKIVMTADKARSKMAYRHSGYPGGLRATSYLDLADKHPEELVRRAVRGMLPHNTLGRQMFAKLKVYPGADHPHVGQNPQPYEVPGARRAS